MVISYKKKTVERLITFVNVQQWIYAVQNISIMYAQILKFDTSIRAQKLISNSQVPLPFTIEKWDQYIKSAFHPDFKKIKYKFIL